MWYGVLVLAILVAAFPVYRTVDQHRRSAALASQQQALVSSGVTGGCGAGNYCPDAPLTRGQMATFLAKALGLAWP